MKFEGKTREQLEAWLVEVRIDRRYLSKLERDLMAELGHDPYETKLKAGQVIKLARFLEGDHSTKEIIEYIEQLLVS